MKHPLTTLLILGLFLGSEGMAKDDPAPFSGPQVGERLAPFKVKGVYDDMAGKDLDFVTKADGKPILLIFVHEGNRPSIAFTRALMNYANQRSKDLTAGVVWLADDLTMAEQFLKRARHAMSNGTAIGVSPDGKEGPGAYGLNRNVTLTILVGNKGKVTANYALVQPSLQADAPKVLKDIVAQIGGKVPTLAELDAGQPGAAMRGRTDAAPAQGANAANPEVVERLRPLIRPMIQKDATPEQVAKAADAIEKLATKEEAVRRELGRIGQTIANSGKLDNYGTPEAQKVIKKWADQYGKPMKPASEKKAR